MTPEEKQKRIEQIQLRTNRLQREHAKAYLLASTGYEENSETIINDLLKDIDFLLALVKEQEEECRQLREETASETWTSKRAIHKTLCPDCQHPIGVHAIDSRIVGCTEGDGSEENPICGCRTLYGEGIVTSMRSACVEKVSQVRREWAAKAKDDRMWSLWVDAASVIIAELESLSIQEQEK